jgi:uncharacterized protein (TIGR02588 family)
MAQRPARKPEPKKIVAPVQATSRIEWAFAALGALVLVGLIAYLTYFALTKEETAPIVSVEALSVAPAEAGHLVRFRVRNQANGTAAGLQVIGELREGERTIEQREATIDYLPAYSSREGGLFFSRDPGQYQLVLSVGGYAEP